MKTQIMSLLPVNTSPAPSWALDSLCDDCLSATAFPTQHYLRTSGCNGTGLASQAPATPGDYWAFSPPPGSELSPFLPHAGGQRWSTAPCPSFTSELLLRLRGGSLPPPPQAPCLYSTPSLQPNVHQGKLGAQRSN